VHRLRARPCPPRSRLLASLDSPGIRRPGRRLRWDRLDIVRADEGRPGDRRGVVEFVASWRDPRTAESGRLHEVSRFRFALGRWYYLDGEVDADR
ncbi:YchJ family metal-binding protein, partial [Microbacterium aurum]